MIRQKKIGHPGRQLADQTVEGAIPSETLHPFLRRIYALLDGQLPNHAVNVNWLADQLAINRKTLYRNVLSLVQLAPAELIRQYRLHKGADLLRAGYTVRATASLVGFTTPSHFTTVFKEYYRQTPTEFIGGQTQTPDFILSLTSTGKMPQM